MSQYVKVDELKQLAPVASVSEIKPGTKYLVVLDEKQPQEAVARIAELLANFGVDCLVADIRLKIYAMQAADDTSFNFGHNDPDPWHDEGNGTNHRLSQCGPACVLR